MEAEKSRINDEIAALDRPIVIIIDEIDRLPPKDVLAVFQLIKAIAAFPRIGYIIAFDPDVVDLILARELGEKLSSTYREKMVQLNFRLPQITYINRRNYCKGKLEESFSQWGIQLQPFELESFEKSIDLTLRLAHTPRDIKRIVNKTLFTSSMLRGEVNFIDILLLETLYIKCQTISEYIRRHSDQFKVKESPHDRSPVRGSSSDHISEVESRKSYVMELLKDNEKAVAVNSLLAELFPTLYHMSAYSTRDDKIELRVEHPANLQKYLYFSARGASLSNAEATQFIKNVATRQNLISEAVANGTVAAWIEHVTPFIKQHELSEHEIKSLSIDVSQAVTAAYLHDLSNTVDEAAELLWRLIPDKPAHKMDLVQFLLNANIDIALLERLIIDMLLSAKLWSQGETNWSVLNTGSGNGQGFDITRVNDVLTQFRNKLHEIGLDGVLTHQNALSLLYRWGQLSYPPYDTVKELIQQRIANKDFALSFARLFPAGVATSGLQNLFDIGSVSIFRDTVLKCMNTESTFDLSNQDRFMLSRLHEAIASIEQGKELR